MPITKNFETTPRPSDCIIGYFELGQVLDRSPGGLRTMANTLPFRRWQCARAIIWDRAEVESWLARKN